MERPHLLRLHGWNVHNECMRDGYVGGTKRRPLLDWVIKEDTHPALITRDEAEGLLQNIEARCSRRRYDTPAHRSHSIVDQVRLLYGLQHR